MLVITIRFYKHGHHYINPKMNLTKSVIDFSSLSERISTKSLKSGKANTIINGYAPINRKKRKYPEIVEQYRAS